MHFNAILLKQRRQVFPAVAGVIYQRLHVTLQFQGFLKGLLCELRVLIPFQASCALGRWPSVRCESTSPARVLPTRV